MIHFVIKQETVRANLNAKRRNYFSPKCFSSKKAILNIVSGLGPSFKITLNTNLRFKSRCFQQTSQGQREGVRSIINLSNVEKKKIFSSAAMLV